MGKLFEALSGKKTIIVAVLMFLVAGVHAIRSQIPALAAIPDATWQEIMTVIQTGGVGAIGLFLRLAITKGK